MKTDRPLTAAISQEIQTVWVHTMARYAREEALHEVSGEMILFLSDPEYLQTSDFVIRRHVQKRYPELLAAAEREGQGVFADLAKNRNIPWDAALVERLAEGMLARFGKEISKQQWIGYLSRPQRIQRGHIFKLALILEMDIETTQRLLMACGKEPYNSRSAHDLIYWFYQHQPSAGGYARARELCRRYDAHSAGGGTREAAPAPGVTKMLYAQAETARDEQQLWEVLVSNAAALNGYSHLARSAYYRFAQYLCVLYPDYAQNYVRWETEPRTGALVKEDAWRTLPVPCVEMELFAQRSDGGIAGMRWEVPDMNKLLTAMFQESEWFSGNKRHGKTDRPLAKVQANAVGLIQTFSNNYKGRCRRIEKGEAPVERQDVLLLAYFFLTGYLSLPEQTAADARMEALAAGGLPLDEALEQVRRLLKNRDNLEGDRFGTMQKCLNTVLRAFHFVELYLPNPFERFIMLSLLSPKSFYISSIFLKAVMEEREEGTLEK